MTVLYCIKLLFKFVVIEQTCLQFECLVTFGQSVIVCCANFCAGVCRCEVLCEILIYCQVMSVNEIYRESNLTILGQSHYLLYLKLLIDKMCVQKYLHHMVG